MVEFELYILTLCVCVTYQSYVTHKMTMHTGISVLSVFLFLYDIGFYKLKTVARKQYYCAPLPSSIN
jgi:hypothetical protein